VATLEDAAEQLVVKLKSLDSEIEESQHALEDLRGRVQETAEEVEEEWSALTESVTSLFDTLHEEQGRLAVEVQETLQATADAGGAVRENGAGMRSQIAEEQDDLAALAHHAAGLEPGVESLVAEAGEAPAQSVAARARAVEQALAQVLEEARDFLQEDVVSTLELLADDVRERCQALRARLVEEGTVALQGVFDDWDAKVDELEDYVSTQGFLASHSHARAIVDWALAEARTACEGHLEGLDTLLDETVRPLQELGADLTRAAEILAGDAARFVDQLDGTRVSAAGAVSALDSIRELLARYSFVTSPS
jgi:hypothetical protein